MVFPVALGPQKRPRRALRCHLEEHRRQAAATRVIHLAPKIGEPFGPVGASSPAPISSRHDDSDVRPAKAAMTFQGISGNGEDVMSKVHDVAEREAIGPRDLGPLPEWD